MNRRERRAEAREKGVPFEPQYTTGTRYIPATFKTDGEGNPEIIKGREVTVGGSPRTHEEAFGVGYERFNNKFVTIKEVETEEETETETVAE